MGLGSVKLILPRGTNGEQTCQKTIVLDFSDLDPGKNITLSLRAEYRTFNQLYNLTPGEIKIIEDSVK